MDEMNTVRIGTEEYTAILELAFKAAILKDVLFAQAALNYDGKSLICGVCGDAGTVAKYLFPEEYAEKLAELTDKKKEEDNEEVGE